MNSPRALLRHVPLAVTIVLSGALLIHGPIAQLDHYHDFADSSVFAGIPHAGDVLSNIAFGLIAVWGIVRLWPLRQHAALKAGWSGYRLFLIALLLTAFGSSYYHLAPDNTRLIWDRLPIALACAGLLAAVRSENVPDAHAGRAAIALSLCAVASVGWWAWTDRHGVGDLRPYLLLQGLPLILIPLWQTIHRAPRADRLAFGAALLLYIAAKIAELHDRELLAALGIMSGHTLKHLLAAAAADVIVTRLVARVRLPLHAAKDITDGRSPCLK